MPGHQRDAGPPGGHQLSDKVVAHLRDQVMSGRLRGGDVIRPEAVAVEFGVSPTPVREALMTLSSEGTVTWRAAASGSPR